MNNTQHIDFKRDITGTIAKRILENRNFIQVITGPRQVGKTTAIRQVLSDINMPFHYVSADLPAPPPVSWIAQQWDLARLKLKERQSVILVLDEAQKISHWSEEVKRLWDEDTRQNNDIKLVVLGSSALLLQKGLNESLAGRFETIKMTHWSWKECRECFKWTLDEFLYFGGYPGAAILIKDENRWAQYVRDSLIETAISKDILLLNRVEKPALLRQLFVLACEYGGQILSYQKLLGQLTDAGNTVTLAHYQKLLESAFLIYGIPKWSGTTLHRRGSSPKWLPLNTGLMTALANRSFQEWRAAPDIWGRLVETAVGAYLVNDALKYNADVYYWKDGKYEVDFVLRKGDKLAAIEVKSSNRRLSLSGLDRFAKKYKPCKIVVAGESGVRIDEFLETPVNRWFD
jgi:uncharacterized protein